MKSIVQGGLVIVVATLLLMVFWPKTSPGAARAELTASGQGTTEATPLPTVAYVALARQDARAVGISPDYFVRQINEESHFNPMARGTHGEMGMCQFLPATAHDLGINPADPVACLQGAARLMSRYLKRYGAYAKALAAYNCGPGCVNHAVAVGGVWWRQYIPKSTNTYIDDILNQQTAVFPRSQMAVALEEA
jgi:soluble lytic murein transglycosylase-like protein